MPPDSAVAAAHQGHFNLSAQSWINDPPPLAGGMITTADVAPDTLLGIGLVKMHGRRRNGSDMRPGSSTEVQTRNPAVTFVFKF